MAWGLYIERQEKYCMQNLPVSIFSSEVNNVHSSGATPKSSDEGTHFSEIFDASRTTYETSPLTGVQESTTTLLNKMGNTLFTGGNRPLTTNINDVTGLFSKTTTPRQAIATQGSGLFSFIESDRMSYGGLPSDFDALTVQNGTLSRDDIRLLKDILESKGAHDASLESLNQLMASGVPLTLSTAMNKLTGQSRLHEELSDDERATFRVFANKIGVNILEGDDMLALSDAGKGKELWNRMADKISALDQKTIDMNRKEAESILKGLDISSATRKLILGQLPEGEESMTLTKAQLNELFSAARNELTARDNAQRHCASILQPSVNEALEQRRLQGKTATDSDMRDGGNSLRLEARMHDSVLGKSGMTDLADEQDDFSQNFMENKPYDDGKHGLVKPEQVDTHKESKIGTVPAESIVTEKNAIEGGLHTITVQPSSEPVFERGATQKLEQMAQQHKQEIFQQVQTGLLKNHANGTTQLTLQLDPKDLGQLSLILTSREGEIRATIRAENAETASVLSEQLESLRATLEEQGLKVAELEVKTGLHNETGQQHWQGTQDHNQRYEADQRARMKRITQLRVATTEQPVIVHSTATPTDGLHVVA